MAQPRRFALLITCEHGGNAVPRRWRALFAGHEALLESHRGLDAGSLTMARELAQAFGTALIASRTTRMLIDLNRSRGHPRLFSPVTRALAPAERRRILERYYLPYREAVERRVARYVAGGRRVLHLSSHSFTAELDGEVRNADLGLLYDPARRPERELCDRWRAALIARNPSLRVRRNYPYPGKADGLTTHLRRLHPGSAYLGIELELNQRFVMAGGPQWTRLRRTVIAALSDVLDWPPSARRPEGKP